MNYKEAKKTNIDMYEFVARTADSDTGLPVLLKAAFHYFNPNGVCQSFPSVEEVGTETYLNLYNIGSQRATCYCSQEISKIALGKRSSVRNLSILISLARKNAQSAYAGLEAQKEGEVA